MNKLKELYHDFHDFPALIVSVLLAVAIFAFFGYIFYLMDDVQPKPENAVKSEINKSENENIPEKKEEMSEVQTMLDDSKIKIVANKKSMSFGVFNGEKKIGEVMEEVPSQVNIFKRINNDVYLGITKNGSDKDSLFFGPQEVYKMDLDDDSSFSKVFDKDTFVSDISRDGTKLVSIERFYVGDEIYNYLNIYDLATFKSSSYQASKECRAAGNAYFSKDGKKIAYEVAMSDLDKTQVAMFVVDLETGEQTEIVGNHAFGKAKEWAENN
jgi:hypothetical protein